MPSISTVAEPAAPTTSAAAEAGSVKVIVLEKVIKPSLITDSSPKAMCSGRGPYPFGGTRVKPEPTSALRPAVRLGPRAYSRMLISRSMLTRCTAA